MQINFRTLSIGMLVLSIIQSGGGNVKRTFDSQSEKKGYRDELNAEMVEVEKQFDLLEKKSETALLRLESGAVFVRDCETREHPVLSIGMKVCLPSGQPVENGQVATWLMSTGLVKDGTVVEVEQISSKDMERAKKILKRKGGL